MEKMTETQEDISDDSTELNDDDVMKRFNQESESLFFSRLKRSILTTEFIESTLRFKR